MKIRDLAAGQLGVLWVGTAFVEFFLWLLLGGPRWFQPRPRRVIVTDRGAPPVQPDFYQQLGEVVISVAAILFVVIPFLMLIVTWKWFGARRSDDSI